MKTRKSESDATARVTPYVGRGDAGSRGIDYREDGRVTAAPCR